MKCEKCGKEIDNESDYQADMHHAEGKCAVCSMPTREEKEIQEKKNAEYMANKAEWEEKNNPWGED